MKRKNLVLKADENFGKVFRSYREYQNKTVKEVGLAHSTVTTFETSQFPDVKLSTLTKYAKGLGLKRITIEL